jgi:hypothetical protein
MYEFPGAAENLLFCYGQSRWDSLIFNDCFRRNHESLGKNLFSVVAVETLVELLSTRKRNRDDAVQPAKQHAVRYGHAHA